jgi:hypothetical protein
MDMKRTLFILCLLSLFAGCGPADWLVDMPPVTVTGKIIGGDDKIGKQQVYVVIAAPRGEWEVASTLSSSGALSADRLHSVELQKSVYAGQDGQFSVSLGAHTRSVGGLAFPGSQVLFGRGDDLRILIHFSGSRTVYRVSKGRWTAAIEEWNPTTGLFQPLDRSKAKASVDVIRRPEQDQVTVQITLPKPS